MKTNYKTLCAELVEALEINDYYDEISGEMAHSGLLKRARAALASPKPTEPSEAEIFEYWTEKFPEYGSTDPVAWAYDVLQRWGNLEPKSISISQQPIDRDIVVATDVTSFPEIGDRQ